MKDYVLGVTGGIASGKSTLTTVLKEKGAFIIDADIISREILKAGEPGYEKVKKAFENCFLPNGELERSMLAKEVFENKESLKILNEITHPLIIRKIKEILCDTSGLRVIDAALLFETGLNSLCDEIWCVTAPVSERIYRLKIRNGYTREEAEKRIASQKDDEEICALSDVVISSKGDISEYKMQVLKLYEELIGRL